MPEYKKEWMEKATLDYYAPFILLWLSFNSWYRSHYSDIERGADRTFINMLKTEFTGRNQPYRKFCDLLERSDKIAVTFRSDLEMLHRALDAAALMPEKIKYLKLTKALIDYSIKDTEGGYINLIKEKKQHNKIQLHELYVTDNKEQLFAGVLESIYQYRNMLVHGHIEPSNPNHDTAQFCYKVLMAIMP
jgi:hypothetical protein